MNRDDKELKDCVKRLVARMLRSLPVDEVAKILADAEYGNRFKLPPLLPMEVTRRAESFGTIHSMPGLFDPNQDPVVKGFNSLLDDLTNMWLGEKRGK